MSSVLLDPRVLDASSLQPRVANPIYLPIGIEGEADAAGTAVVGTLYAISRVDDAVAVFGAAGTLMTDLITEILNQGAGPVVAVASAKGVAPTLVERQTAWASLESDENVRLRLTDSTTQADLVALAESAKNANLLFNKQVAIVGMPHGTDKATLITAATAIAGGDPNDVDAATRAVLVAPGVYDSSGTLRDGNFTAAAVAAEIAKNADPSNDLDLWPIPFLTGVELDTNGLPLFRRKVVAGAAVDDYEDLLQAGISPLQPTQIAGGVMTTHLRTLFTTNGTYDSLFTRIIVDQVFLDVKSYILSGNFLRMGNTDGTRARIASGVAAVLNERSSWISPITQGDGSTGYAVTVTASADQRQVTVGYQGTVIRGISTVQVAANLTIPV